MIQEEKQSAEQRAEELESQVGSIDSMSLLPRGCSFERGISPSQSDALVSFEEDSVF